MQDSTVTEVEDDPNDPTLNGTITEIPDDPSDPTTQSVDEDVFEPLELRPGSTVVIAGGGSRWVYVTFELAGEEIVHELGYGPAQAPAPEHIIQSDGSTRVEGLEPGTFYGFATRIVGPDGPGPWGLVTGVRTLPMPVQDPAAREDAFAILRKNTISVERANRIIGQLEAAGVFFIKEH